ncbi:YchJ family protein [Gammaproteobacteria bacterium AS21]
MLSTSQPCPCGSFKTYNDCCLPVHNDQATATQAEQLMRARYSAFVLANIDFLIQSHYHLADTEQERAQIKATTALAWCKLEIVKACQQDKSDTSFVEFKAWYLDNQKLELLHEKSRFIKKTIDNQQYWYYVDGTFPKTLDTKQAVSRNGPCPCNSGKKFKRCCAI